MQLKKMDFNLLVLSRPLPPNNCAPTYGPTSSSMKSAACSSPAEPAEWRRPFVYTCGDIEAEMSPARTTIASPLHAATYDTLIGLLAAAGRIVGRSWPRRRSMPFSSTPIQPLGRATRPNPHPPGRPAWPSSLRTHRRQLLRRHPGRRASIRWEGKGRKQRGVPLSTRPQDYFEAGCVNERAARADRCFPPGWTRRRLSRAAVALRVSTHSATAANSVHR